MVEPVRVSASAQYGAMIGTPFRGNEVGVQAEKELTNEISPLVLTCMEHYADRVLTMCMSQLFSPEGNHVCMARSIYESMIFS